jgi:hypothetical protein
MDEATRAPYEEDDELNQALPEWAQMHTRRKQILQYFKEHLYNLYGSQRNIDDLKSEKNCTKWKLEL